MNSTVSVELTRMAATGEAIGRDEEGHLVFVADAVPGETVEVEIVREDQRGRRGLLRRVLAASPDRIEAPCPHFGPPQPVTSGDGVVINPSWGRAGCSGCQWQQIDYERQLALKREIAVEILAREGGLTKSRRKSREIANQMVGEVIAIAAPDGDTTAAAPPVLDFGFRTQMRFNLAESGRLTYPARGGDRLEVDACPLLHPQLAKLFAGFVESQGGEQGEQGVSASHLGVTLAVGGTAAPMSDADKGVIVFQSDRDDLPSFELDQPASVFLLHEADEPSLELVVGDWSYNVEVAGRRLTAYPPVDDYPGSGHLLADEILATVAEEILELKTFEHLLELGAGIGARTILLAEWVATVVAVEEADMNAAALRSNLAGVDNADAWHGAMLPTIRKLRRAEYRFDAALLAPPDRRIEPELFSLLTRMRIRRCALITDDPTRLARALADVDEAGYRLAAVQPIDLRPHHSNVTLVARFDRK